MGSGSVAAAQASAPERGLKILALDSALKGCSVALLAGGEVAAEAQLAGPFGQAEHLVPLIERVMAEAGLSFPALDLIAATIGPGSFTGLRVGLAAARGLALTLERPLRGIGTLEAMAAMVPERAGAGRPLLVTIDARRGEIYAQLFAPGSAFERAALSPPALIAAQDLPNLVSGGPLALAGPGRDVAAAALPGRELLVAGAFERPEAIVIARLAASRGLPEAGTPPPAPLYLRAPDARLPTA